MRYLKIGKLRIRRQETGKISIELLTIETKMDSAGHRGLQIS